MNRKTIIAAITITRLLVSLVGVQFVDVANANPYVHDLIQPPPPNGKPPVITVFSMES